MATGTILEKNIYFLGSWKVRKLSDQLHSDIAQNARDTRGLSCVLSISQIGIQLIESGGSRTVNHGLIPEKNVVEMVVNKSNRQCVMCVVKDAMSKELLNVMVWKCRNQNDVSDILSCFIMDKHSGKLLIKERSSRPTTRLSSGDHRHRTSTQTNDDVFYNGTGIGGHFRNMEVQTDITDISRKGKLETQNQYLMEEINSLQREVKELRLLVKSQDVSRAQYFVRRRITSNNSDQFELVPVQMVDNHVPSKEHTRVPTHDRRSYAIQTDLRRYTAGRQTGRELVRYSPNKAYVVLKRRKRSQSEPKYRINSSGSVPRSHMRIDSDSSENNRKVLGYVTLPPEKEDTNLLWSNGEQHSNTQPPTPTPLRLTVKKPIEDVYGTPRYRKHVMSPRPRKEITPHTFVATNGRLPSAGEDKRDNIQAKENGFLVADDFPMY